MSFVQFRYLIKIVRTETKYKLSTVGAMYASRLLNNSCGCNLYIAKVLLVYKYTFVAWSCGTLLSAPNGGGVDNKVPQV